MNRKVIKKKEAGKQKTTDTESYGLINRGYQTKALMFKS